MKEVDALVKLQAAEDAHDQEASKGKTGLIIIYQRTYRCTLD